VHVEARANRNQLIMFSTIIAFIDFLIILPCRGLWTIFKRL
jgi:hypothetical protein